MTLANVKTLVAFAVGFFCMQGARNKLDHNCRKGYSGIYLVKAA